MTLIDYKKSSLKENKEFQLIFGAYLIKFLKFLLRYLNKMGSGVI